MKSALALCLGLAGAALAVPATAEPTVDTVGNPIAAPRQPRQQSGSRLQGLDTNGDGVVSRQEFTARCERRFDRMDADGDGMLSADEFGQGRGRRGSGRPTSLP